MNKFTVFFGLILLVFIAVAISRLATGPAQENASSIENTHSANIINPLVPLPCGFGLASQDLAGVCRAKPNPTPGALEAVGERNPIKTKIQSKLPSKK